MRNCPILSSSSGLSTGSTAAFIGRTPLWRTSERDTGKPIVVLPGLLSYVLIGDARDLPLCRVSRCRSKGQSVMEPFAKAKRRASKLGISHEQERPSVVGFDTGRTNFAAFTPERLKLRAIRSEEHTSEL